MNALNVDLFAAQGSYFFAKYLHKDARHVQVVNQLRIFFKRFLLSFTGSAITMVCPLNK